MRITSTQLEYLWEMNVAGGTRIVTSPLDEQKMKDLQQLGLVIRPGGRSDRWVLTPKGMNVSLLHKSEEPVPAHSVVAEPVANCIGDSGIMIAGQKTESGTEIMVKGKQGIFRFLDTHVTKEDRIVLNLIGPLGGYQSFTACYLEDAKLIPPVKVKRKRKVRI